MRDPKNGMRSDLSGIKIPVFTPDPEMSLEPINLAGPKVFMDGPGGDYDISGWTVISITPSAGIQRWFNDNTTRTRTVRAGETLVIGLHLGVNKLTISGVAVVEVEGM